MSAVYSWQESDQLVPSLLTPCCPRCEAGLTLHQPDPELPDRLLATCDECKAWFITRADAIELIRLPGLPTEETQSGPEE
jgi:hypothetical protein